MREERYQGQHGAQPSSSMILHTGYFCEWYQTILFLSCSANDGNNDNGNNNDDDDDETDFVVSHSPFFY